MCWSGLIGVGAKSPYRWGAKMKIHLNPGESFFVDVLFWSNVMTLR